MVSLGFIANADQAPARHPRVCLGCCDEAAGAEPSPTIRVWTERGVERFELRWDVPSDPARLDQWTPAMAASLRDLGLPGWWLDPATVAAALRLAPQEALTRWGLSFWAHYRTENVVYIEVGGLGRAPVYQSVRTWERRFDHVRFGTPFDLDLAARQRPAQTGSCVSATLSRCLPAITKARQGKFNVASWLRSRKH